MTAVTAGGRRAGKRSAPNKKLFYVLAAVVALALLLRLMPGLLAGGGTGVHPTPPKVAFHLHKARPAAPGAGPVVVDAGRDPFGSPPGYTGR